ncbi:MAG: RNA polymerase sigma factor [Thermoguttaceae bacterium]
MNQSADADLPIVQAARKRAFSAFESLVSKYQRRLYGLALRMVRHRQDAEEVVQQTFLSVIEHLTSSGRKPVFTPGSCGSPPTTRWPYCANGRFAPRFL